MSSSLISLLSSPNIVDMKRVQTFFCMKWLTFLCKNTNVKIFLYFISDSRLVDMDHFSCNSSSIYVNVYLSFSRSCTSSFDSINLDGQKRLFIGKVPTYKAMPQVQYLQINPLQNIWIIYRVLNKSTLFMHNLSTIYSVVISK